ncbi:hypothetical protein C457_11171 [Haloferax prahovense DSM 18310]|uniref:Uncharacterized protein n=1 Tax=Haloferax prahovense (strain DSM 18310 / JCM 13924 / TL6) TaxID=1227461 RepID=M0G8H8_HALPT|nr:hypothetical protein C457_11171 [Haloferax prahovense DSM 18310]
MLICVKNNHDVHVRVLIHRSRLSSLHNRAKDVILLNLQPFLLQRVNDVLTSLMHTLGLSVSNFCFLGVIFM